MFFLECLHIDLPTCQHLYESHGEAQQQLAQISFNIIVISNPVLFQSGSICANAAMMSRVTQSGLKTPSLHSLDSTHS